MPVVKLFAHNVNPDIKLLQEVATLVQAANCVINSLFVLLHVFLVINRLILHVFPAFKQIFGLVLLQWYLLFLLCFEITLFLHLKLN